VLGPDERAANIEERHEREEAEAAAKAAEEDRQQEEAEAAAILAPVRSQVHARLLFLMSAPARQVVTAISAPAQQLMGVVQAAPSAVQVRRAGPEDIVERRAMTAAHAGRQ
jgi:hypothetical protein